MLKTISFVMGGVALFFVSYYVYKDSYIKMPWDEYSPSIIKLYESTKDSNAWWATTQENCFIRKENNDMLCAGNDGFGHYITIHKVVGNETMIITRKHFNNSERKLISKGVADLRNKKTEEILNSM